MYTHIYIYTCNLYTNTQNTQIPMLLTHSLAFFFRLILYPSLEEPSGNIVGCGKPMYLYFDLT